MSSPKITLILSPGSCSLAPHILLHESRLPFTTSIIPAISSTTSAPESLRAINPKMRVPVLLLDGETITEVPAIMTAISQLVPERGFMGKGDLERVRCYEWLNWLSGNLHGQAFGCWLRPQRFCEDEGMWGKIREKGRKSVLECFGKIEGGLRGVHAVGQDFTAADAYLYVFWRWGQGSMGVDMKEAYPKWGKLVEELVKRESVRKMLVDEGIKSFVGGSGV